MLTSSEMSAPVRVAVLDDEESYRRALSRLLRAHGYDVETFATGEGLRAGAAAHRFDCVLLDLYMPGMSGFDVLAELKLEPSAPPVIVITAHDDADHVRRALALGAFECQHKPIGAPRLIDAIERARRRLPHASRVGAA
ncbi:MAG: response regulator transcription factor [Betaproteobacteria bacterium]